MATSGRKFLVIGRVGDKSLHKHWLQGAQERKWDLALNAYGKDQSLVQDGDIPTVFDPGTKWDSIARQVKANPDMLSGYTHIMLPDDDLMMSAQDINRMFEIVVENGLTMAQPALSYESYITWPILLHVPGFKFRYCTYLESMACVLEMNYFKSIVPMFEKHYTGWGTDLIWTMLMKEPAYKAAIVDEVQMTHTRPLYSGPIYNTFADMRINPPDEIKKLTGSFRNYPDKMVVYGGVAPDGQKIDGPTAMRMNAACLVRNLSRSPAKKNSLRMACAMLLRSVTMANYKPEQLQVIRGSAFDQLGITPATTTTPKAIEPEIGEHPHGLAV